MMKLIQAIVILAGLNLAPSAVAIQQNSNEPLSNWNELTALPGSLPSEWVIQETGRSDTWILHYQGDPSQQGQLSLEIHEDDLPLKTYVDQYAADLKDPARIIHRVSKTYSSTDVESIEINALEDGQNNAYVFLFFSYNNKIYSMLLTTLKPLSILQGYKDDLLKNMLKNNEPQRNKIT